MHTLRDAIALCRRIGRAAYVAQGYSRQLDAARAFLRTHRRRRALEQEREPVDRVLVRRRLQALLAADRRLRRYARIAARVRSPYDSVYVVVAPDRTGRIRLKGSRARTITWRNGDYSGTRYHDSTRAVFVPGAWLAAVLSRGGSAALREDDRDGVRWVVYRDPVMVHGIEVYRRWGDRGWLVVAGERSYHAGGRSPREAAYEAVRAWRRQRSRAVCVEC